MNTICLIHGLNSSHRTFAYLDEKLNQKSILVDYDSRQRLERSIREVLEFIPTNEPVTLIGHSLGGLISALIAARRLADVRKLVTISTPLGGSRAAVYARWVATGIPLLNDITPNAPAIREVANARLKIPMLSVISTGGSLPTSTEPNDSVVSVSSQRALVGAKQLDIRANHFEVMLHEQMASGIRQFLYEDCQNG